MHDRELFGAAKLALLVIGIVLEPVIEFSQEGLIVSSLHHKLLFQDLEERLFRARFEHVNAALVVWESNFGYLLTRQFRGVHFSCEREDMMIELLLELLVAVVDA